MNESDKKKQSIRGWVVIVLVTVIVMIMIVVARNISDGFINKSRLSAAMQTLRSVSTALSACQISGAPILPPDSSKSPTNLPCFGSSKYPGMGGNSTRNCVYNTEFVPAHSEGNITRGAIQAGCNCTGMTVDSCKQVFQCDFATTGRCAEEGALK